MIPFPTRPLAPLMLAALVACGAAEPTGEVRTVDGRAIEFDATVAAADFAGDAEMSGYHLIVWRGGGAADHSLFRAEVTDSQVLDALIGLGAEPGNGLRIDSWDERYDPDSSAPDRVIAGPPVRIEVRTPDSDSPLLLEDFLVDPGERGFDMRFGGHRANIPEWHSGCVVCLYSCPGSKVGNATYTVRDFVQGATHFGVDPGALPPDGTSVRIRLILESRDAAPRTAPAL